MCGFVTECFSPKTLSYLIRRYAVLSPNEQGYGFACAHSQSRDITLEMGKVD